jgi:O-antigen ligase
MEMYDNVLTFVKRDGEYIYETSWGKEDQMVEVAHANAGGLEYLGSGRVYIWTRIVPLLKKYILVGSGPDTFAEVFPQNDYSGKLVYAENPARIIERAHNDYLMKWVQTGLLSVLALLAFYFLLLKKGFAYFGNGAWTCSGKNLLALGCLLGCVAYMVCGLFSDSTLYTSPVFYVFVGIVLSVVNK